jgi:hypothetical protein
MYQTNNYTPDEIKRMQRRAVERVRNMENIAKQTVRTSNLQPDESKTNSEEKVASSEKNDKSPKNIRAHKSVSGGDISEFLNLFASDKERALLILLILLLISDNENPTIIFTLIYILL